MVRIALGVVAVVLAQIGWKGEGKMLLPPEVCEAVVDSAGKGYYEAKFAFYPALATSYGVQEYDDQLSAFSGRQLHGFLVRTKRMQARISQIREDSLSLEKWIDYKALLADMTTQVFLLEDLETWRSWPTLYANGYVQGIHTLLVRPGQPNTESNLVSRLSKIPEVVEHARNNLTEPSRLHCEVASSTIKDFLPLLADLPAQTATLNIDVDEAVLEAAVTSLKAFALFLDSLAVDADPDFALGYDNFAKLLDMQHMIYESPKDLLAYAEHTLARARQKRSSSGAPSVDTGVDRARINMLSPDDIISHCQAVTQSARAFIQKRDLMGLPDDSAILIVETPVFLRGLVRGYAYEPPGPFDSEQVGLFYVPALSEMDEKTKVRFLPDIGERPLGGGLIHEAYPGHQLQISTTNKHPSSIRRLQLDWFAIQGWALYCEEMMATEGYGGGDRMNRMLDGIIFRAAAMIADIRLQVGEYSLEDAAAFMIEETGAPDDLVEREVRRYAVEPAQAMGYIVGKREIMRMREDVRGVTGEAFSPRVFHDSLLSCGSIPLYLLRACVMSAFK